MRMFSLIFFAITLIFAYKAAFLISEKESFALTVAAIIALMPSVNSSSFGGINNDAALIAFSHIMFYSLLKTLKNPNLKILSIVGNGLLLSVALLSKPQAVIFIPLTAVVFLYKGIKERAIRNAVVALCIIFFIALIITAPFYIDLAKYFINNPAGSFGQPQDILSLKNILSAIGFDIWRRFSMLLEFWLQSQLFINFYPFYFGSFIMGIELAALIGLVYIAKGHLLKTRQLNKNTSIYLALCGLLIFTIEFLYTLIYYKSAITDQYYNMLSQGRYYFPVVGPIIILLLFGLRRIFNMFKIGENYLYAGLVIFFLFIHNYALFNIIMQYNYL